MPKVAGNIDVYKSTLKNVLSYFSDAPEYQVDEFVNLFTLAIFPKKKVIIPPGNQHNKLFFIIKGVVRIYYVAEGKEITSDFKEENSFFINGYTIFTGLPNFDIHETLEETICLEADYQALEDLARKYHRVENLARRMVEKHYADYLKHNFNMLFLSAEERYAVFMKDRASIVNRVSLRFIASHLGITPETLSRLRSRHIINPATT